MVSHKYEVGQNVGFRPNRMSSLVGPQEGKIVRLLPIEAGSYLHRIKCTMEKGERIAKEGDLALRSPDQMPFVDSSQTAEASSRKGTR
jgi:hypothetical protein